ncbi:MAG: DnaJ domain-containing protein [Nitrospirae bacterium]|nr:DnaJ domain-containing protein [Nitrospirota bacterium]
MNKLLNYLWITLLSVYIISPIDANPLFFDDLIAAAALFYFVYKNAKQKQQYSGYDTQSKPGYQSQQTSASGDAHGPLTLDKAYRILGVSSDSTLDEISKAYKEKMTKSHPDKVSHLSEELQERAKELTLELNEAYECVKRHTKA